MKNLVLHPETTAQLKAFARAPSHALLIVGNAGSGKSTLARRLAEQVLQIPGGAFEDHPYTLRIAPEAGKAIGIEVVRQLEKFLALKVPSRATYDRAIIIEDAQALSLESQNALLKMLEEPPTGTLFIMTVNHRQAVLPTIRSRAQSVVVNRPNKPALETYFTGQDFDINAINQAYAISGGLPGLMHAILHEAEHPLLSATAVARQLLSQSTYERLLMVDDLAKQRQAALDIMQILQQMAHVSLLTAEGKATRKWESVLSASYETAEALLGSAQPKLALTKLMLTI